MTEVIKFVPRAEVSARQRVDDFIALARDQLTALITADEWKQDSWDVSSSFVRKGKSKVASRLHFLRHGTTEGRGDDITGEPLRPPFAEFARAFIRYQHAAAPMVFERLIARLNALRFLEAAYCTLGREPDISALAPEVLVEAVRIAGAGVTEASRYQRGALLQKIQEFCRDHQFLATPFVWKHGVRKPKDLPDRVDEEAAQRRKEKLPEFQALEAIAIAYKEPLTRRDQLLTAVSAICMCVPIRIHEVLQLRTDCLCDDERRNEAGQLVKAVGIRVWPGKNNPPQVKWVPDVLADMAREAVARLQDISEPARRIARWYVANPDRMYLPPEFAGIREEGLIDSATLGPLVGAQNGMTWVRQYKLTPANHPRNGERHLYRFADVERAIVSLLPRDFPLHNGQAGHLYSESLVLVRLSSLKEDHVGDGSPVMFEPIDIDEINDWLGGHDTRKSVFERYGVANEDGTPIKMTSHGFRHWLNDLGHRKGLGALDIAHWSGRAVEQNKFYDHQTPAQFREQLQELAERAGGVGPLFDAADSLQKVQLISRSEFLKAQIGSAHHHDLGACIHDYSLLPCQKFGNCAGCGENVFTKGEPKHRANVQNRRDLTARQLEEARQSMDEGDYGADLWVRDHQAALGRLDKMLAIHDDASIADGTIVNLPEDGAETEVSMAMRLRETALQDGLPGRAP